MKIAMHLGVEIVYNVLWNGSHVDLYHTCTVHCLGLHTMWLATTFSLARRWQKKLSKRNQILKSNTLRLKLVAPNLRPFQD